MNKLRGFRLALSTKRLILLFEINLYARQVEWTCRLAKFSEHLKRYHNFYVRQGSVRLHSVYPSKMPAP
jgi:hypothetical protein